MRKKKDFAPRSSPLPPPAAGKISTTHALGRVHFPVNTTGKRSHDFTPFYGKGIDRIVKLVQRQVERLLAGEDKCFAVTTLVGACNSLTHFLKYFVLVAETKDRPLTESDVNDEAVRGFLVYLSRSGMQINAQKKRYDFVKLVLVQLLRRNKIVLSKGFPANPFPRSNRLQRGPKPYTVTQRKELAKSLRAATANLFESDLPNLTSEQLSLCFLAVAFRTGVNFTPLLELRLEDIRAHVKPGMKLLTLKKRRGNRQTTIPFRSSESQEVGAVLPSTARLLDQAIARSNALREAAPAELKSSVWLYRSGAQRNRGKIIPLTPVLVKLAAAKHAQKFHLCEEDGSPLAINVPRMRKTFVNRIYELSSENVIVAARAAGHSPRVAATNYLVPDRESERNWKFMGDALVHDLTRGDLKPFHSTPAGRCRDITEGEFAPKNGSICISYLDCFRCRSYVVTASDLHKIFSLYWMIVREREALPKSQWKRVYAHIIRTIDVDIVEAGIAAGAFDRGFATAERHRAHSDPHPFWRRREQE